MNARLLIFSRGIVSASVGLLVVIAMTGCAKSMRSGPLDEVQPVSSKPRAGNAYLLRGFIGVFSTGIDDLGRQLNGSGIRAHVYQDDQWSALAKRIGQEYRNAPDAEPLVLIGHSYGADDVVRIARLLDKQDIAVDLMVTLDPVTPPAVPKNVRHALNLYQSNGLWDALPFLRGVALKTEPGFVGRLENFDIKRDRRDLLEPGTDHFNIEKKGRVHEEVVGYVLMACPPRQTWLATRGKLPPRDLAAPREARLAGSQRLGAERSAQAVRSGNGDDADAQTAGHRAPR